MVYPYRIQNVSAPNKVNRLVGAGRPAFGDPNKLLVVEGQ